jgi:carbamoyltransferase
VSCGRRNPLGAIEVIPESVEPDPSVDQPIHCRKRGWSVAEWSSSSADTAPHTAVTRCIIHSHTTTWHDGAVALRLPSGQFVALAAERVGDRYKHSWNSRLAYEHLANRPEYGKHFRDADDFFVDCQGGLETGDHHLYHAASSFLTSGFSEAAILVIDGQGPRDGHAASTTMWIGDGDDITFVEELLPSDSRFAEQSLGHYYTAIGVLAGMTSLYDEGKTMALAAYGRPSPFLDWLRVRAYSRDDGTYFVDPHFTLAVLGNTLGEKYYGWPRQPPNIQMLWDDVLRATRVPAFTMRTEFQQGHMDVAFAGETILEEIVVGLAHRAHTITGCERLCLAGGVALNCVANQQVARRGPFSEVHVPYAPGDEGQALGKLLLMTAQRGLLPRTKPFSPYLGPTYTTSEILAALASAGPTMSYELLPEDSLVEEVVSLVVEGAVVALCFGPSELGPRALGHRSLIADPRRPEMRQHINANVKQREWFRPLAPMVVESRATEYFDLSYPSPFMARAVMVKSEAREVIPAVVHVDRTARVQTVSERQEPRCHRLLLEFERRTGIPILLNTSFNRREEPIVETPSDALSSFSAMPIEALVLGDYLVKKREL